MRILQVAPLYESVPPKLYGGTERVVAFLSDELVRSGHDVTLFAAGDSRTRARLHPITPRALRLDPSCVDELAPHVLMLEKVLRHADEFDVIHFHLDYLHLPLASRLTTPHLTTQHGRLDLPQQQLIYPMFPSEPLVSISNAQRRPLPRARWQATVYHGLPRELHAFRGEPGKYLAFVGRISPEKMVDAAIEVAKRVGIPLKIAAKVSRTDQAYFEQRIAPLLEHPLIEFVGEIDERQKTELLSNALALMFTIDWPEPFGLAMIEAMACGTPVIAYDRGSVSEVMEHGVTGFVVNDVRGAVAAVHRIAEIDRAGCRAAFERRFLASRMAEDYLDVYVDLIDEHRTKAGKVAAE